VAESPRIGGGAWGRETPGPLARGPGVSWRRASTKCQRLKLSRRPVLKAGYSMLLDLDVRSSVIGAPTDSGGDVSLKHRTPSAADPLDGSAAGGWQLPRDDQPTTGAFQPESRALPLEAPGRPPTIGQRRADEVASPLSHLVGAVPVRSRATTRTALNCAGRQAAGVSRGPASLCSPYSASGGDLPVRP
jgi:hypothetical protein